MARKKPDTNVERVLFTFAEAQEFLRVSHQTIYKLLEQENSRLKRVVADFALDNAILKEAARGNS